MVPGLSCYPCPWLGSRAGGRLGRIFGSTRGRHHSLGKRYPKARALPLAERRICCRASASVSRSRTGSRRNSSSTLGNEQAAAAGDVMRQILRQLPRITRIGFAPAPVAFEFARTYAQAIGSQGDELAGESESGRARLIDAVHIKTLLEEFLHPFYQCGGVHPFRRLRSFSRDKSRHHVARVCDIDSQKQLPGYGGRVGRPRANNFLGANFVLVVGVHHGGRALQAACLLARPPHVLSSLTLAKKLRLARS